MKKKILIVDDVASNIHMLSTMLKEDYSIVAAKNGRKAIELANKEQKPDLVLLDVMMPDMNGYEVCKALKECDETRHIPVIFVSSLCDNEEHEKVLDCGGDDYLPKPVTKDNLHNKVKMQLRLGDYIQNRYSSEKGKNMSVEKAKVLIVDDAPENIQIAVEILKDNYTVSVATSGEKALAMIEDGLNPDLILLDIIMPDLDGFQVCTRLKENEQFKNIPIIFLTILENEHDMVKGLELGAVDYVTKPFESKVLKARVDTHVKLKKYQDDLINNIHEKENILISQSKLATLGEMFENISHQWSHPLSVISMVSSTIKMAQESDKLEKEVLLKSLDSIDESVDSLSHTVNDFKDFLIDGNPKEYFKVKKVIKNILKLLDSKLCYENIDLIINLENYEICNYKNDFIQVLMTLLTNLIHALKGISTKKQLLIKSSHKDSEYVLSIKYSADETTNNTISKAFHNHFDDESKSLGLCLFVCKRIIEKHMGGKLQIITDNNEAKFELRLPAQI